MTNSPIANLTTISLQAKIAAADDGDPTPRMNLHNIDGVRREMSRVYRDMRGGVIATQDGTRLVYVLSELRKMFEVCELEKRIERMESHPQLVTRNES